MFIKIKINNLKNKTHVSKTKKGWRFSNESILLYNEILETF